MATPEYMAAWREQNREGAKQYAANYRAINSAALSEKRRREYAANPKKFCDAQKKYRPQQREYQRKRRGLPEPTRPCPLTCECCDGPPVGQKSLHLDHDHATGEFRGWLCSLCNTGLGSLGDNLDGLKKAETYLRRPRG